MCQMYVVERVLLGDACNLFLFWVVVVWHGSVRVVLLFAAVALMGFRGGGLCVV
jgi:hypothetical protein